MASSEYPSDRPKQPLENIPTECNALCDPAKGIHSYLHASPKPAAEMQYLLACVGTVKNDGLHGIPPDTRGYILAVVDAIECDPASADCDADYPFPLLITWQQTLDNHPRAK